MAQPTVYDKIADRFIELNRSLATALRPKAPPASTPFADYWKRQEQDKEPEKPPQPYNQGPSPAPSPFGNRPVQRELQPTPPTPQPQGFGSQGLANRVGAALNPLAVMQAVAEPFDMAAQQKARQLWAFAQRRQQPLQAIAAQAEYEQNVGPIARMATEAVVHPLNAPMVPGAAVGAARLAKAGGKAAAPLARELATGQAGAIGKKMPKLPPELVGAKPRYNIGQTSYLPQFESDTDKALFIISQTKKSARDADYFAFIRSQFPDVPEATLRNGAIRQHIKGLVKGQPAGDVRVPESGIAQQLRGIPVSSAARAEAAKPADIPVVYKYAERPGQPKPLTAEATAPAPSVSNIPAQKVTPPTAAEVPPPQLPPPSGGKVPRKPIWAMTPEEAQRVQATGERAPALAPRGAPPARPPEGPPPTVFPSGRRPGGPDRTPAPQPFTPEEDLALLEKAVNPPSPSRAERAVELGRRLKMYFIDSNDPLVPLQRETSVPVHDLSQLAADAGGAGEELIRRVILPVIEQVKGDEKWLELYMVARRNEDILARYPSARLPGGMQGWRTTLQAQKAIETKLGPERFKAVQNAAEALWDADRRNNLELLRSEGILDDRALTTITSTNRHYIPWNRSDFEGVIDRAVGGRSTASLSSTGIKKLELAGSERTLDKPLARFTQKFILTQERVARNRAAKALVRSLEQLQQQTGEELLQFVEPRRGIAKAVNISGGAKPLLSQAEHSKAWDTVSYYENGQKVTVNVPRIYAEVAKNLNEEASNILVRTIRVLNAPLRHGAVTYNPVWPAINTIMNTSSAWFREGVIPFGPDMIKGIEAVVKKNQLFSEVAGQGILMRNFVDSLKDMTAIQRATRQLSQPGAIQLKNAKDVALLIPRIARAIPRGMEKLSVATEQTTRIAAYNKLKREGVPELERAIRAKEVTVDFSKMGTIMRTINAVIPFTNAALQGSLLMGRTIVRKPKWALIAASPFMATTVASRVNNMRFDTSNEIPSYEYTRNWVFQFGEATKKDGTKIPLYFKIPKGPLASILTFPAEAAMNALQEQGDKSVASIAFESAFEAAKTASPVDPSISGMLPPLIQTGVGMATGVDPWSRREIVPAGEQDLLPEQQFGPETSAQAVALGKVSGVSPRMIDWAIKDYSAGAGEAAMSLLSLGLEAVGYKPEPFGAAQEASQTTPETLAQAPGIKRFFGAKATESQRRGWEDFNAAVERTNREFAALPDVNRLGIRLGSVGDSIDMIPDRAGGSRDLSPQERTAFQKLMSQTVIASMQSISLSPTLTDVQKLAYLQKRMQTAKDLARDKFRAQLRAQGMPKPTQPQAPVAPAAPAAPAQPAAGALSRPVAPATAAPTAAMGPASQKWAQVSLMAGSQRLQALNDVWYSGKALTPQQEAELRYLFKLVPLGESDFNVWLKRTLRQTYENAVREGYKARVP